MLVCVFGDLHIHLEFIVGQIGLVNSNLKKMHETYFLLELFVKETPLESKALSENLQETVSNMREHALVVHNTV